MGQQEFSLPPPTVTVVLPRALLDLFPEAVQRLQLSAPTLGGVIEALDQRWPGMRDRLCDSTPRIRRNLNIFVDGERGRLDTRLRPGATVHILTAISGG